MYLQNSVRCAIVNDLLASDLIPNVAAIEAALEHDGISELKRLADGLLYFLSGSRCEGCNWYRWEIIFECCQLQIGRPIQRQMMSEVLLLLDMPAFQRVGAST